MGDCCRWQQLLPLFFLHRVRPNYSCGVFGIFLRESITSRFYRPKSWFCWVGVTQAIVLLFIFNYGNFFTGLVWFALEHHHWAHAFLPLGIANVLPRKLHRAPRMGSLGSVAWARPW